MAKYGNPTRMDLAALDFTGVQAVTTPPPSLADRIRAAWSRTAPAPAEPAEPDPYVWLDADDLDAAIVQRSARP